MESNLSKVKVGDKIWTIQEGWTKVIRIESISTNYPIMTQQGSSYTIDGKREVHDKYPSAFLEYPLGEEPIEKDTLVYFKDSVDSSWKIGYYSHYENRKHFIFIESKKSTETDDVCSWNIVKTENPLM